MAYQFNPQVGATTSRIGYGGWSQSSNVQSTIGMGREKLALQEQRRQREEELALNREQFDVRMGWEQESFNKQMGASKRRQEYEEKRGEKAERIGQFGMSLQSFQLGMNLLNEYEINPLQNMGLKGGTPTAKTPPAGGASTPSSGGETSLAQQWGGTAVAGTGGAAIGGLTGSSFAQAVGGQGKTQSTLGGAIGGGLGAWSATGNYYAGVGGMFAGGLLGYLLG